MARQSKAVRALPRRLFEIVPKRIARHETFRFLARNGQSARLDRPHAP